LAAAVGLWALWPRSRKTDALTAALVHGRIDAMQTGADVANAQAKAKIAALDFEITKAEARHAQRVASNYAEIVQTTGEVDAAALERIAVTETSRAFNDGVVEQARQIQEETGVELERIWRAEGNACEECAGLDGKTVGVNEDFPEGEPGSIHPNCNCESEIQPKH
jgi:hypothetical protein